MSVIRIHANTEEHALTVSILTPAAVLLDTVAEPHYIQCVDLWGGRGVVVAAGQNMGRISFVTFRRYGA